MKILTANICLGLRNADNLWNNMRGIAAYHSWSSFLVTHLVPPLRGKWGGPAYSVWRTNYFRTHENLQATFDLIANTNPDILILNEIILEIHADTLEKTLREFGYVVITHGGSEKYPDRHISTWVASKIPGEALLLTMPQLVVPGGGGGTAGLRLTNGISVIGLHAAYGNPSLWREQVDAVAETAANEQMLGQRVILAGDWNEPEEPIIERESFKRLSLQSVDRAKTRTCPTSLPRFLQSSLDHIFVPNDFEINDFKAVSFSSDHLALFAEVESG